MKYPKKYTHSPEPQDVRAGDLVWWNEGSCVGFVEEVLEEKSEYESWGCLDEPSLALTNLHPFEANERKHKQRMGEPSCGGTVVMGLCDMEDEGIGPLSEHESAELDWAISNAKSQVQPQNRTFPFCVNAVLNQDRGEEDWIISFVDFECKVLETVSFTFRPNTRTKVEPLADENASRPTA